VLVFWASLLVPGYAVARRIDPDGVESGLLAAIALSFLAAVACLALVAVPCYVVEAPLWILSATAVGFVLWGAVDLARARAWGPIGRIVASAAGLEIVVIGVDLVLGGRVGTVLAADAIVHVGRVRFLLEHGLANQDQFIAPAHFYPIYHSNILHALLASAAQVTGASPVDTWFSSLVVAKLLVVAGAWYAGWAIFRSGPAGWVTALFVLGARGPVTFMLYPNQLAPWYLLPMLVGFAVRAVADGPDRRCSLGIGATALLIGMTHSMYAVFVAISIGPVLAAWALLAWRREGTDRRATLACVAALVVAVPFPLITVAGMKRATAAGERLRLANRQEAPREAGDGSVDAEDATEEPVPARLSARMRRLENGWVMHKLHRGFNGPKGLRWFIVAMAGALMVLAGRRREMILLVSVLLVVAAWLHVPPLCTLLLEAGGAEWVIHRFAAFQSVVFALMVGGSIIAIAECAVARSGGPGKTGTVPLAVLRAGLGLTAIFAGAHFAHLQSPYDWRAYLDRARAGASIRHGRELRPLRRFAEDMDLHVPAGTTVLADPSIGMRAVMVRDCRVIASTSSSTGVPDLGRRTRDIKRLLRAQTPEDERDELLARYGVTHLLIERPARRWTYERMSEFWATEYGWCIIALRPPGEPAGPVRGDYDQALVDIGEHTQAISWLQRRLVDDPNHFGRRFRLGNALARADRHEEAVGAYMLASELRPDDPRPAIMIGNAFAAMERYDEAIDAYLETVAIADRTGRIAPAASGWYNIGNMHYRLGRWSDAIAAYDRAIGLNPDHGGARQWRSEALANEQAGAPPPDVGGAARPAETDQEEGDDADG
jgi:tetratricopeptide (TPR) repeat protein